MPLTGAPYREIFSASMVPPQSCPTRGVLPPLEPAYDAEMEMDDEIVDAPMDLEPLAHETPEEVRAEQEALEEPAEPEPPPPPAAPQPVAAPRPEPTPQPDPSPEAAPPDPLEPASPPPS
jgi:hypothetical protein